MSALHDAIGNRGMTRLLTQSTTSAPLSIQRRASPGALPSDAAVSRETLRDLGPGQPLEQIARAPIEAGLGFDVSGVRIHTDAAAAQAAHRIRAEAFAFGQDIYFGSGRYRPDSQGGRHLLAHELVHTVQQRASGPADLQASPVLGATDDNLEREAATIADRVTDASAQGRPPDPIAPGQAALSIQRQPDTGAALSNASSRTYRPPISARDVAAFGPKPTGWDSQFGQPNIAPDPTISDLEARQSERLKFNPGAKELDGVELAQAWTSDLGDFESAERRRFRIDQLVESMLDQLPAELWLPSDTDMQRALYRSADLQVIDSGRQVDPAAIRNKLFTRLKALRGEKIDTLLPEEPIWSETAGDMVGAAINAEPFTDEENLILWFLFSSEMREWARREVAVQASVRQEHERRGAVVTSAAAGGALQFIAVGSIPAMLAAALLALPAAAAVATEASATGAAASDFALSTGLRMAPQAVAWALANPQTAIALTTVGANVGHDLWSGDFSGWNIPFYVAEIWGARMGDRSAQASSPVGEPDEIGEQAMVPSLGARGGGGGGDADLVIDKPVPGPATGKVSQKITSPTGGGTFVGEYDTATGRKTITNVATGEVMVIEPGTGAPALGPGQSAGDAAPSPAGQARAIDVPDTTGDQPALPAAPQLALKPGRAGPRYVTAPDSVMDDETKKVLSDFDRRVAKTGLIGRIQAWYNRDRGLVVRISGKVEPGKLTRNPARARPGVSVAPSFNNQARSRLGGLTRGLQRLHLWGPGFGDEAAAGMFVGPKSVNQVYQNGKLTYSGDSKTPGGMKTYKGIEGFVRELADMAKSRGGTLNVEATAEAWPDISPGGYDNAGGEPMLKSATYKFNITGGDGEVTNSVTVSLTLEDPATWTDPANVVPVIDISGSF
jgi:hypothetical protein